MKRVTYALLLSMFAKSAMAQSVPSQKITGKVEMLDGNGIKVHGDRPLIGHDIFDPSDTLYGTHPPADFTRFDAGLWKIYTIMKAVPDLNPPVGFDARVQINSYHRKAGGMYDGWLRIWIFPYYHDRISGKNIPAAETGEMVWVYINDLTILCGNYHYFSDTIHQVQLLSNKLKIAKSAYRNKATKIEIVQKQKPLFTAYTIADFLIDQRQYYREALEERKKDLEKDQNDLSQMTHSRSPDVLQGIDENIKEYQADLSERQKELRTATGGNKTIIQNIIDGDKKMLASAKTTREKLAAKHISNDQQSFNNALMKTYSQEVENDKKTINDLQQELEKITDQYNHLSITQRAGQAFIKPLSPYANPGSIIIRDEWDNHLVTLLQPGDHSGLALYCYNPAYFDQSHPSDIQLILLTGETGGNGEIMKKQWEIIQQANGDKLKMLISGRP